MISAVAEFYSIVGLTAIFSAAFWPVVIMGACLGVGKVTAAVWLKLNWERASWTYKLYLVPAVAFLMLLTSMGIFGYLSKAHSDQSMISGDSMAKVAIYDEKIKIAKDNIDANRKALKQMDEAVDQVMGRSSDEKGADKAVGIRRSQQKERTRLQSEIQAEQKTIATLSEERAPLAAEFRKIEAEVGPIKYIAALVYDDNPDANVLEKAVRLVIILIVAVFDPLALVLILAAQQSLRWAREERDAPKYAPDDGPLTDEQVKQLKETVELSKEPLAEEKSILERHPYLLKPFAHFQNLKPMVATPPEPEVKPKTIQIAPPPDWGTTPIPDVERPGDYLTDQPHDDEDSLEDTPELKAAKSIWKEQNPNDTLKNQRVKLAKGLIPELPWITMIKETHSGFGTMFPVSPSRGDTFVKTDCFPTQMYKFNGQDWILIDKTQIDNYNYDTAYIDHLISKISTGEYDPELLTEGESTQVAERLNQK